MATNAPAKGISGRLVVLIGFAVIGLVAIPLLLAGWGSERFVDLRSLRQMELSSWRVGSFHLTPIEVREIDEWPMEDIHAHVMQSGLGSPVHETPSQYWEAMGGDEIGGPPLWHSTFRLMPMAFIVRMENRRPMTPEARAQLDLRLIMASLLDPAVEEDRAVYRRLDERLSRGVRVFDPLDPPRGRVGYVAAVEGERFAREVLDRVLDSVHGNDGDPGQRARKILIGMAQMGMAQAESGK